MLLEAGVARFCCRSAACARLRSAVVRVGCLCVGTWLVVQLRGFGVRLCKVRLQNGAVQEYLLLCEVSAGVILSQLISKYMVAKLNTN